MLRDSGGSWEWKFSGKATSNEAIALSGAMYAEGKLIRDCSVQMTLATPASTSLAAKAKSTPQLTQPASTAAATSKPINIEKSVQNIVPTTALGAVRISVCEALG